MELNIANTWLLLMKPTATLEGSRMLCFDEKMRGIQTVCAVPIVVDKDGTPTFFKVRSSQLRFRLPTHKFISQ